MSNEKEVHVLIGCSDARDIGGTFVLAVEDVQRAYLERGIEIEFHSIRTPGSFVTIDVIEDLRRIVEASERALPGAHRDVRYFVHIQTHGDVEITPGMEGASPIERIEIVRGSHFNCGMLGAGDVSIEFEREILARKPTVQVHGRAHALHDEHAIHRLLAEAYAFSGYLAGDWIRSIDDLRTHPRLQKSSLEKAIAADRTLRNVPWTITAGIQDYEEHRYYRVDGEDEVVTFWDDVYVRLRERIAQLPPEHPEIVERTAKQSPVVGLFSIGSIRAARTLAAEHYAHVRGQPPSDFGPNMVFTFASNSFDLPRSTFGPYTIAGFYYAVAHLHLDHFVVMGRDDAQTRRMVVRLRNDPLMNFIATTREVSFIPVSADRFHASAQHPAAISAAALFRE